MTEESLLSTSEAPDDGTAFLADLAAAMKATADRERERVAEDVQHRRELHLASINERRETEVARMRELAEDDLRSVDVWAENERRRIQEVRERRAASVRQDLEASLAEHGSKVEREIEAVDKALEQYRMELDRFFQGLEKETDPVAIARHASRRPAFPALDRIGEEALTVGGAMASPATETPQQATTDASLVEAPATDATDPTDATQPIAATDRTADASDVAAFSANGQVASDTPEPVAAIAEADAPVTTPDTTETVAAPDAEPATAEATSPEPGAPQAAAESAPAGAGTPPLVAVMDTDSSSKLAEAWAAWNSPTTPTLAGSPVEPSTNGAATEHGAPAVATAEGPATAAGLAQPGELTRVAAQADADDQTQPADPSRRLAATYQPPRVEGGDPEDATPVNAGGPTQPSSTGSSISSMPISRPMSWLRRDRDRDNSSNG